ncbi:Planctomycete cytochrome C [Lignipirellula cremea]|uniref:Planctomycete cytochrome C n=1 Tax=Lignipirellula cremea TaxID=2528010 RepID=A0A518E3A2_9BACT|nr:Planctomycete cytochrome C [Lignipirellula cremea]
MTFEQHAAPILKAHCWECHGGAKREAGLDLRRRFALLDGGDSGPAIKPGKPDDSLLLEMIADGQMPPDGKTPLAPQQIATLRAWIADGAAIAGESETPLPADDENARFSEEQRRHWAFQPVQAIAPPAVADTSWLRTPVDAFLLAALEQHGWRPAAAASRRVLIRRVTFDLTGLPPSPEAVEAFINDRSADAYERVVDALLASPRYGERAAQHWLDVVRYAETEGFEYDRHLPDAWRYRDYVIGAFNADIPFDQFIREQLAGDELRPRDPQALAAAVFHRLGTVRRNAGNPDIAVSRNEVLTERTNIVGEAFLGLSVGCARCHDHKLEPISQKDYYRLQAYFAATVEDNFRLASDAEVQAWEKKTEEQNGRIQQLKAEAKKANDADRSRLEQQILDLEYALPPAPATIPTIRNDAAQRTAMHVLRRGEWEKKGVAVGPRPLSILSPSTLPELPADTPQPRTRLADWIADGQHPLSSRVIVNRIWQQHFGVGLVATANDFGVHGSPPSHPQLLDWLAHSLVQNGWKLKPLHRLIVLSNAYQQSSRLAPGSKLAEADPNNRWLGRFSRRRLSAEELRDAMLAVSGRLNLHAGGPSVIPPVDPELVALLYKPAQWRVTEDVSEHNRRSIYLIAKRNLRLPFMETFDAPALQNSCPQRETSTHAPQALELTNGDFANAMAAALAERLERNCGDNHPRIVQRAYQLAAGREPTPRERELSLAFLAEEPLREFALAVLNLQGFLYVD